MFSPDSGALRSGPKSHRIWAILNHDEEPKQNVRAFVEHRLKSKMLTTSRFGVCCQPESFITLAIGKRSDTNNSQPTWVRMDMRPKGKKNGSPSFPPFTVCFDGTVDSTVPHLVVDTAYSSFSTSTPRELPETAFPGRSAVRDAHVERAHWHSG